MRFWLTIALMTVGTAAHANEGIHLLGRYTPAPSGGWVIGWPGSGIEFRFQGSAASIDVEDDGRNGLIIETDGVRRVVMLRSGTQRVDLLKNDRPGKHHITIRRKTESYESAYTTLRPPRLTGRLIAKPDYRHRILFVGDSITAGYGLEGEDQYCGHDYAKNIPDQSYAALLAKRLDADYHLIAISGRGVVFNYNDDPRPNMLAQWSLALPDATARWDHKAWIPDAVVVSLGTNDWSTQMPGIGFTTNYAALLHLIATDYPSARIVAVSGPLLNAEKNKVADAAIDDAISRVAKRGIAVTRARMTLADSGVRYSCNWHPGRDSMAHMAQQLIAPLTVGLAKRREAPRP
jgi:lysophospholipase L1-like esterase